MFLEKEEEPIFVEDTKCKGVTMQDKLLTVTEVAEILSVKKKTLYQWRWAKRNLTFLKVGGCLRVSEKDLMELIRKRKDHPCED